MNVIKSSRTSGGNSQLPRGGGGGSSLNNNGFDNSSSSDINNNNIIINLYQEIPTVEVSLDDFEEFALDRLKVLKKLEQLKLKHVANDKHKKLLDPLLSRLNNDPIKDWVSHFVLRLAYCRTEDLRRWFLAQEVALLKYRLYNHNNNGNNKVGGQHQQGAIVQALTSVLPNVHVLSTDELEPLLPKILAATPSLNQNPFQVMGGTFVDNNNNNNNNGTNRIYRVPFTQALDLIQHRQVYVKGGQAYIPETKLLTLVTAKFRTTLSRQLVLLSSVPSTPALQRTQGFLNNVATVHTLKDEFAGGDNNDGIVTLNAGNVQSHLQHMPLCMANLQLSLTREKHLKHWSRLQYGLFLKGAGLSLEDALTYFEKMFVGSKDFTKEYSYNVRHMYGKEGKRTSYPPYNCSKIINGNAPNHNEHHGCPYKHGTVLDVTTLLTKLGIQGSQQKAILAQQQSHNYQLACVEHFKVVHPGETPSESNFGNHPNAWFSASVKATATSSSPTKQQQQQQRGDMMTTAATTTTAANTTEGGDDAVMKDPISVSP